MTDVMYMGPRSVTPPCYCVFLRAALQQLGLGGFPFFSHSQVRWSNSVVFFDTLDAPANWLELVRHYSEQGNIVIVIFDGLGTEDMVLTAFKSQMGRSVFNLRRTWEAHEVRAIFARAEKALAALVTAPGTVAQ